MIVQKAVILAAGAGTRFLPYTKAYPKEMLAVTDKPALQLIVEEVAASGIRDILIVISPEKEAVVRHFARDEKLEKALSDAGKGAEAQAVRDVSSLANVSFAYQDKVTGTGKAVLLAKDFAAGQPFAVLNGDDVIVNFGGKPVTAQLAEQFEKTGGKSVVGVQEVSRADIAKYASAKVCESFGRLKRIDDIVEKPKSDAEVFSLLAPLGRYVVSADIFDVIERTPPKPSGEVYLTDSLQIQAKNGGIYVYEFEGTRFDFGDKLGYLKGVTALALADKRFSEEYRAFLKKILQDQ